MDKQLAGMLADCLDWIEQEGGTVSQAAARFPQHREELQALLNTIHQISQNPSVQPRAEFEAAAPVRMTNLLRARQKAAVAEQAVTLNRSARRKHRNIQKTGLRRFSMSWLIVIFTVASLLLGGGGVAYASTDALPGDGLYGVKTILQDAQLAFSDDLGDLDLLAGFLTQNIEEMNQLAAQGRWEDLDKGLDQYQENLSALVQTRDRVSYLEAPNDEAVLNRIQSQLHTHAEALTKLQEKLQDRERLQDKIQEQTEDPTQDQTRDQTREQTKDQTQDPTQDQIQDRLREKLHDAIQQTDQGKTYGPAEGGPADEPGSPNGAGPGDPQGTQNQNQDGSEDGSGNGQGGKP